MTSPLAPLRAELRAFLAGGPYMPLRAAVMDAATIVDDDTGIPDADRDWFDELYEAVEMAAEDPVDARARKAGVVGAAELREQLRSARLDRS